MNETIEGGNYICKIRLVLAGTDRPEFMAEWLKHWTVKPAARHSVLYTTGGRTVFQLFPVSICADSSVPVYNYSLRVNGTHLDRCAG